MGFLSDITSVAAPVVGGIFGGPAGAVAGAAVGGVISGREQEKAAQRATEQQLEQIRAAQERVEQSVSTSQGFLEPLSGIGQRGVDLAGFLADPQAQAELAFNNPLFELSRRSMVEDINQSAAARGRSTAGDTLTRLDQAAAVAAQPFIDRQRQDNLNLLNIASSTAGQQAGIEQLGTQQIVDLITGGGATQAAGTVAAQNARTNQLGSLIDLGLGLSGAVGTPPINPAERLI